MAHTKGDWFYDERTESIGFAGGWLGSTKGREGEGLGDQHDDGRLMAAASDLLNAGRLAKDWMRHLLHYSDHPALGHPNVEKLETDLIILSAALAPFKMSE